MFGIKESLKLDNLGLNKFAGSKIPLRGISAKIPIKTHDRLKKLQGKLIASKRQAVTNSEVIAFCIDYIDNLI